MSSQNQNFIPGNFLFKYRGIIPAVALAVGLFVYSLEKASASGSESEGSLWACFALACFGELIRIITVGHTPKGTSGRNTDNQLAEQLNTKGMYSISRNPLYFGNFLIWLSVAIATENWWFIIGFVIFFWWFYDHIIRTESSYLQEKFGEHYLLWAKATSSFFPTFNNYQSNSSPFNWKKVLRKEKNGIAAIMAVYGAIGLIPQALNDQLNYTSHWFFMAKISVVLYLSLKAIMSFTGWLDNPTKK